MQLSPVAIQWRWSCWDLIASSYYDPIISKCGECKNFFSFKKDGLFVLMGKLIINWQCDTWETTMLHHEETICGEEMHPLISLMLSVMASNVANGWLKIQDRSH